MDQDKLNLVADLIDKYGEVQTQPCGCCLELQKLAEEAEENESAGGSAMDEDKEEDDMDVDQEVDVETGRDPNSDDGSACELTGIRSKGKGISSSSFKPVGQSSAAPPAHKPIYCTYNDNAYGTNLPKEHRSLVRYVISGKNQRGKCGNCLRNQTICTWDVVTARPNHSLESPVDSGGSNGLFGQRSASLGGWEDDDDRESSGNDWVQDDDTGSIVRRSRRATATPGPVTHDETRRHQTPRPASERGGSFRRASSVHSTTSSVNRSRTGTPAFLGGDTTGRPSTSKASKASLRMKQNINSALSGTMRRIRIAELIAQQEKVLGIEGGAKALQELNAGYKKASRARTPPLDGELGNGDNGMMVDVTEEVASGSEDEGAFVKPVAKVPRPRATLLQFPLVGTTDDPHRTEDYRVPEHFLIGGDEEDRLAEEVRTDTVISLEGGKKSKGKGKSRARSHIGDQDTDQDSDIGEETPVSARFRKCLGCTLRECHCEPIELRRASAAEGLSETPLQADILGEGCKRCRDCGVLCSFSLVPPIYGQWDHLILPKRGASEDDLLQNESENMADFDQDNPGVTGFQPMLTTSNKCTGCRLRNVACMALPPGENDLGGCQKCRDCNVSCSFSIGHPEVEDQGDWVLKGKEVDREAEEVDGDDGQVVNLPPRKPRRRRLTPATGASSELSSPPDTPMSLRSQSAFAKANSVTPVKAGRRPQPLILALPPRGKRLESTTPIKSTKWEVENHSGPVASGSRSQVSLPPAGKSVSRKSTVVSDPKGPHGPSKAETLVPVAPLPKPLKVSLPAEPVPKPTILGKPAPLVTKPNPRTDPPRPALPVPRTSPVQAFFVSVREALQKIQIPTAAAAPPISVRGSGSSASPPRGITSSEGDGDVDMDRAERIAVVGSDTGPPSVAVAGGGTAQSKLAVAGSGMGPLRKDVRDLQCLICVKIFSSAKELRRHRDKPIKCKPLPFVNQGLGLPAARSTQILFTSGTTMFRCPEIGCNKAYPNIDDLRWHRNFGFCPDEDTGVALAKIVPCTSKGCRQVFQSDEGVRQHLAKGKCIVVLPPPPPPLNDGKLAAAINGVLDGMDIVLAAMNTPPEEVTQNVAIAYGGLSTAINKLKAANQAVGTIKPLTDVIVALDTFGKGL